MTNAPHSSAPTATDSKAAWRRWARTLPPPDSGAVGRIADHLIAFLANVDGLVLGYVALPDEVDIAGVLVSRPTGTVALPRLNADGTMTLHVDDGEREQHTFGVSQPPARAPRVRPDELAAVLVPGRVFDGRGYRLGRGGGHYDRLLTAVPDGVPTVGVVTADRVVDAVPTAPHDVPMTHLATEPALTKMCGD